jgi:photosystem II stability/assembly factor-like uncharacterized protein
MKFKNTWSILLVLTVFISSLFAQEAPKLAPDQLSEQFHSMKWRNIGPFRGGRSVAAVGLPHDPTTYYAGYTGGGVWKTENAGQSWKNISDGFFKTGSVGAIAIADSDPNVIYVGMGEHAVRGVMTSPGDGMYKSTDAGKTWHHIGLPDSRQIARIQIHPKNADLVYVAVQGPVHGKSKERGVYKSTDGGKTWKKVLYVDENTGASELSMDYHNPRVLYAGMWDHIRLPWRAVSGGKGSGLYKSTDGGETWNKLTKGLPAELGKTAIAVSRANPNVVYANLEAEGDKAGVYRSDDGGETWRQTSKDRATITRAWYYIEIFPDPIDSETVYVLNAPMLKSTDGGRTFSRISVGHGDTHDMWINPNNNQNIILADDGGAEITFNGGTTWSTLYNQPTAQFYRVITDNRFPYFIYAGQQDNSSVAIPNRTLGAGISDKDWYAAAGCECAFLAFDPDNPVFVYGGCYQGYIQEFDQNTRQSKDIMAYPRIGLGTKPSEQKYRFNWNAPIVAQPQNPKVIYHAAQKVLRTEDGGITWREISSDLTRNEVAKQDDGGGPFTNEGAGGEIYNTISYLAVSPHQVGVMWAGSDCGLVHLTRDEGKNWTNVTPPNLGELLINAIEISPHNPSAAYVVATRYKFDDFTPMVYYTNDWGKTWTKITNGFDKDDFVRVVREDRKQPGLLYAGTERGLFVSFDNGKNWQKFQSNLPAVPITDLTIQDNDLIAATSGRSFWVLDDLGPFQQSMGKLGKDIRIFESKPAYLVEGGRYRGDMPLGENPPSGVLIHYYLPKDMSDTDLTMLILDKNDNIIRTYKNKADKNYKRYEGGPQPEPVFDAKKGVNRFVWDFRRETAPGVPGVFINGDYRGSRVAPGDYKVRLVTPEGNVEQAIAVAQDPRVDATPQDYAAQQEVLVQLDRTIIEAHNAVNNMREVREQIQNLNASLKNVDGAKDLVKIGEDIIKKINEWEEMIIQPKQKTFQDVINFYNRMTAEMMNLRGRVDQYNPKVTGGAKERLSDLVREWDTHRNTMNKLITEDIAKYNKMYLEQNFPAINIPKVSRP